MRARVAGLGKSLNFKLDKYFKIFVNDYGEIVAISSR